MAEFVGEPWEPAIASVASEVSRRFKTDSRTWIDLVTLYAQRELDAGRAVDEHNANRRNWVEKNAADPARLVRWLRRRPKRDEVVEPLAAGEREVIERALKAAGEKPGGWSAEAPFPAELSADRTPVAQQELRGALDRANPDPPPHIVAHRLAKIHDERFPANSIFRKAAEAARFGGDIALARALDLDAERVLADRRQVRGVQGLPLLAPGGYVRREYERDGLTPETMREDLLMLLDRIAPDERPLLTVDSERMTATLDGETHPLSSESATRFLAALAEHPGRWFGPEERRSAGVTEGRIDKLIARYVPERLKVAIESDPKLGYRLRIPS